MRYTTLRTAGSQRVPRRRNHCPTQEREPTMGRDNIQKSKQHPPSRRNSSSVMKPCIVFVAVMAALPANFSRPSIAQEPQGKLRNGTSVNLTCSTVGGYPAPRGLDWIISGRNETIEGEMQTPQDDDTKLYNVTSRLPWFFTEMVNISCRIQLVQDLGALSSEIWSVELEDEVIHSSKGSAVCVIMVGILVIGAAGLFIFVKKRKKRRHPSTDADGRPVVCDSGQPSNREEDGELMVNNEYSSL